LSGAVAVSSGDEDIIARSSGLSWKIFGTRILTPEIVLEKAIPKEKAGHTCFAKP
jgi:hypothetical protein